MRRSDLARIGLNENAAQNVCRRPERLDTSAAQDQHVVHRAEQHRTLRDDDDGDATLLGALQRFRQRLLAFGVEVGVRLIEHDERRIAEERAREGDALPLTARKWCTAALDHGLVAVGQLRDHLVHAGNHRGLDRSCRRGGRRACGRRSR